jgi:hypothetical protein
MSWKCVPWNTRGTTLEAEKEAAAAGTKLDNASLIDILMGRMTVNDNPLPIVANVTWPDKEHVAQARHAIENPFLVIPHPKNADHPLCMECGIFAASTLVVPASIPEWPACKGMFPYTHCWSCATADNKNEYVFEPVSCGCGVSRRPQRSKCYECDKGVNQSKICLTEGCGEMRDGSKGFCILCRRLNDQLKMTCFLCGGAMTRHRTQNKYQKNKEHLTCYRHDNIDCFKRCKAYDGGVRGGEGGNNGRCKSDRFFDKQKNSYNSKTCGHKRCKSGCTLLSV